MVGRQTEALLVNKWLWDFHKHSLQWRRIRLGVVPNKELAKMYSVTLRWCDALFIKDGYVNIVEAKLKPDLGAIGQLEGYRELFKVTPEFRDYWDWPVNLIYLSAKLDLVVLDLCKKKGIEFIVYNLEK